MLQAGHYGAPQGRQRVIFLGARSDISLPQFPAPQYNYPKAVNRHKLPDQQHIYPHFSPTSCDHGSKNPCVPLPATTVEEAIGDLVS